MSFKKIMQVKGKEMVAAAANEVKSSRTVQPQPKNPKSIPLQAANKLIEEIKENKKATTSISLSKITIDENVRKKFSTHSIKELGESLKDVGLLHNVMLHLVKRDDEYFLHCVSGMRRVLAAESIAWEKIEADITLEQNPIESLYVGAIANLHESVFWLDNALLYSKLYSHNHSDEQIAERVKVNPRTVGWFRRLANMSPTCQKLAYDHPDLFNSTWAQQIARHGDLPPSKLLEQHMRKMIVQKRTWHVISEDKKEKPGASSIDKSDAVVTAHRIVTSFEPAHFSQTELFLRSLAQSGFLTQSALKKIQKEFFKETPSASVREAETQNTI